MKEQNYDEWLAALKTGDEVSMSGSDGGLHRVERLTATLVILAGVGRRFKRKDGYMYGSNAWNLTQIKPVTQEARDEAERKKLAAWLGYLRAPSLAVLRAMKAAHDKAIAAEADQ